MKRWRKSRERRAQSNSPGLPFFCNNGKPSAQVSDAVDNAGRPASECETIHRLWHRNIAVKSKTQWRISAFAIVLVSALCVSLPLTAAILPEDRADALYHRYDGGGVTIDGPSIMVRKQIGKSVSVMANEYQDSVTSASIDVESYASPYTEKRKEQRLGLDYLHENTTMNLTYVNSEESDYTADTYDFSVSHVMFGELTTVTLGYGRGTDDVGQNSGGVREDKGKTDHYKYRLGLSQVLTKNLVVSGTVELDTDEGFLNNPYRNVYVIKRDLSGAVVDSGFTTQENYPKTHTSNAVGLVAKYYLPYRAAVSLGYRTYSDTWDVVGNMYEIGYTHPLESHWIFDFTFRTYSQTASSFYADAFEDADLPVFRARDKELSTYSDNTLGVGLSYEFGKKGFWIFDKGSVNLNYSRIKFDYQNFTDQRPLSLSKGQPYGFTADVFRFFVSVWY